MESEKFKALAYSYHLRVVIQNDVYSISPDHSTAIVISLRFSNQDVSGGFCYSNNPKGSLVSPDSDGGHAWMAHNRSEKGGQMRKMENDCSFLQSINALAI